MKTFPFQFREFDAFKMLKRYFSLRPRMVSPTNTILMAIAACDLLMVICPAPWFVYAYTLNK